MLAGVTGRPLYMLVTASPDDYGRSKLIDPTPYKQREGRSSTG